MPDGHRHPTDPLVDELTRLYAASAERLKLIVVAGLRRGLDPRRAGTLTARAGDATLAYRARQYDQAKLVLAELERQADELGPIVIGRAYGAALRTVDHVTALEHDDTGVRPQFGRVHVTAVATLAGNMAANLKRAAERVGTNIGLVFERANMLDGALPASGRVGGVPFLGRRKDDPYRRVALDVIAGGLINLDTRKQVSAQLAQRLVNEGLSDGLTALVDDGGRRWTLPHYAEMVARTTTREAVTQAVDNRLEEHGIDLVAISTHRHPADECTPYEGNIYSRSGRDPRYPKLVVRPPFHPFCVHVMGPASVSLDDFEAELERRAAAAGVITQPADPAPDKPPPRETVGERAGEQPAPYPSAVPHTWAGTEDRLDAQQIAYAITDPGPEPGADEAWAQWVRRTGWLEWSRRNGQTANAALNSALGPDLAKYIDRKWGKEAGIRERILNGELTIEDAEELAYEHYQDQEGRRLQREVAPDLDYGLNRRAIPCFTCGWLKRRPSDVCDHCGDDPVQVEAGSTPVAGSPARHQFDRDYGYGGSY